MAESIWAGTFDFLKFYAWCEAHEDDAPWSLKAAAFDWDRELAAEMDRATFGMKFTAITALRDMGMDVGQILRWQSLYALGRMRVEFGRDGFWNPIDVGGAPALILPVLDGPMLVDMVAFSPLSPDQWYLRRGDGRVLGSGTGQADWETGVEDIPIFATPFDWMMAGGEGICILTWDERAIRDLMFLGGKVRLMADSHELREHIEQQIKAVPVLPEVGVQTAHIMTLEAAE
ncbi:hypothetical protein [Sphingorhabdus sp. 109]|uniref:hypothetical protein n=1 Tax=Sphingorhabdus sp. 109 TaxID=2653173 RepID=UPI001359DF26|nr:hypothetical protein [Sphingorhabdus sp. 109]